MSRQIFVTALLVSAVLMFGMAFAPGLTVQTASAKDKDVHVVVDVNVKVSVQNKPGPQGPPGPPGEKGDSITGPAGGQGAQGPPGNVTVNICVIQTLQCTPHNVSDGDVLSVDVNASATAIENNTEPSIPPVTNQSGGNVTEPGGNTTVPFPTDNQSNTGNVTEPTEPTETPGDNSTGPVINGTLPTNSTIPIVNGTIDIENGSIAPGPNPDNPLVE